MTGAGHEPADAYSEITKRPVVTMRGEDVAQIKDVVFSAGRGAVGGFMLAGRSRFSGPSHEALPWSAVAALGSDAVMIDDEGALRSADSVLDAAAASAGSGGNVLGSQVLTESGVELGTVVDVVIEVEDAPVENAKSLDMRSRLPSRCGARAPGC